MRSIHLPCLVCVLQRSRCCGSHSRWRARRCSRVQVPSFGLFGLDWHDRAEGHIRLVGEGKYSNMAVACLAKQAVSELRIAHPEWSLAMCCFYNDQVANILVSFAPEGVPSTVSVDTVDGYQGLEYDCIVLACGVWQHGSLSGQANWEDPRRINVLLSRARKQVVVLASSKIMVCSPWWRRVFCASPWVRADAGPGSSVKLQDALNCLRRHDTFLACVHCCRGTDRALPSWCFSNKVLKKIQAAQRDAKAFQNLCLCVLCNAVQEKHNDMSKRKIR